MDVADLPAMWKKPVRALGNRKIVSETRRESFCVPSVWSVDSNGIYIFSFVSFSDRSSGVLQVGGCHLWHGLGGMGSFLNLGIRKRTTRSGHRVVQFRVTSVDIPMWIGSTVEDRVRYKCSSRNYERLRLGESHDRRQTMPFPCRVQFVNNQKKNLSPLELTMERY